MNNSTGGVLSLKSLSFYVLTTQNKDSGLSCLQSACIEGDVEIVSAILNNSPDKLDSAIALSVKIAQNSPHFPGESVFTALNQEHSAEHEQISKLVEKVAEDFQSQSLLHIAARKGNVNHLRRLLDCGYKVDSLMPDHSLRSPLMFAARFNETDVVEFLVRRGASFKRRDKKGENAFHHAAKGGKTSNILRLIELGANTSAENNEQQSAIHLAAAHGHTDVVGLLVERGANVNKVDHWECTPLMLAAQNGHLETIQLLLKNGAEFCTADCTGWLPLHHAAGGNHTDVVKFLLQKSANLFAKTSDENNSVLHLATRLELVSYLVEQGADIHARTYRQSTPLHAAAEMGQSDTVDFLLSQGADINSRDGKGHSALCFALRSGHAATARMLVNRGYDFKLVSNTKGTEKVVLFLSAAQLGLKDVLQCLVDVGLSVDTASESGKTALIAAAEAGKIDLVAFLLDRGANVDAKARMSCKRWCSERHRCTNCETGNGIWYIRKQRVVSPLYCALKEGHGEVAKLLIERGADTSDPYDETVHLALVKLATEHGLSDVIQLLEENNQRH